MQHSREDFEIDQNNDQVVIEINRNQIEQLHGGRPPLPRDGAAGRADAPLYPVPLPFFLSPDRSEGRQDHDPGLCQRYPLRSPEVPRRRGHHSDVRAQADAKHLDKVERLLYAWVDFVKEEADSNTDFSSFEMNGRRD